MKKIRFLITVLFTLLAMSLSNFASAESALLFDKHTAAGMTCIDCHGVEKPTKPAATDSCLACHGENYETLAKMTEKLDPNPHYTHLGDMPCSECHNNHKPSVNMCASCHNIDMKVP